MSQTRLQSPVRSPWPGWLLLAAVLLGASLALRLAGPLFGLDVELDEMPIVAFVALYCLVGMLVMLAVPQLIRSSVGSDTRVLLYFIVAAGLLMRLLQLGATPILEDDYNRYLWDGAVTVAGHNPYTVSPEATAQNEGTAADLIALRNQAGAVFDEINYPEYRTIYPPVAQVAFALSHLVAPFSLDGWRGVLIVLELAALGFLIAILSAFGRSPLWAALYWWNPVVVKELANSAHMEPVLVLPLLAGVWLVLKARPVWATGCLAIAAGVKLWPMALAAVLFRRSLDNWRFLLSAAAVAGLLLGLFAWPVLQAGLGEDSGFVAYAQKWQASSAAFLVAQWLANMVPAFLLQGVDGGAAARAILIFALAGAAAFILFKRTDDRFGAVHQMFLLAAALYLLSPSQFPWYFVWIAPFLCIFPMRGLMLAGALLPLHYAYFHYAARDLEETYRYGIVWLIWLPVWGLLAWDALRARTGPSHLSEERYASQS